MVLVARIGNLFRVLGELDLWYKHTVFILDGGQLIDAPKGRAVLRRNQVGSYTPDIDGGTLLFQVVNQVFIQIVGSRNFCVWESRIV